LEKNPAGSLFIQAVDADIVREISVRRDPLARHFTGQRDHLPMSNVGRIQAFRRVPTDRPINAIDGRGGDLFRPIKYLSDVLGPLSTGFERRAVKLSDSVWNSGKSVGCQRQSSIQVPVGSAMKRYVQTNHRLAKTLKRSNVPVWSTTHWMGRVRAVGMIAEEFADAIEKLITASRTRGCRMGQLSPGSRKRPTHLREELP
jgi:hypothetical protein